jgi:hypothetical protein
MANSEGFTVAWARDKKVIGILNNYWRQRYVYVYEHPSRSDKVVSVGYPMQGGGTETHVCVEDRESYERCISLYPKAAEYR